MAGGIGHLDGFIFADGVALGHREGVVGIIAAVPRILELPLERYFHAIGSGVGEVVVSRVGVGPRAYALGADFIVNAGPEPRYGSVMVVRQALFHAQVSAQGFGHVQVRIAHVAVIGGVLFKVGGGAEAGTHGTENTGGGILARHLPGIGITPREVVVPNGIMLQAQGHAGVKVVRGRPHLLRKEGKRALPFILGHVIVFAHVVGAVPGHAGDRLPFLVPRKCIAPFRLEAAVAHHVGLEIEARRMRGIVHVVMPDHEAGGPQLGNFRIHAPRHQVAAVLVFRVVQVGVRHGGPLVVIHIWRGVFKVGIQAAVGKAHLHLVIDVIAQAHGFLPLAEVVHAFPVVINGRINGGIVFRGFKPHAHKVGKLLDLA